MNPIYIAIAVVAVALLGLLWWRTRRIDPDGAARPGPGFVDTVSGWTPQATRVLTNVERKAYETLRSALPAHVILAQVPLARFIKVPTRNSYAEWLRRAGQLCADLVVCDRHSQVVAVVELRVVDDSTSERVLRRQKRLERVLKAAEIPVHFWQEDAIPSPDAARDAILPPLPQDAPVTVPGAEPKDLSPALPPRAASPNPLNDADRDMADDEVIVMREPPPSTWFGDIDTEPAPLEPPSRQAGRPPR